MEYNLTSRERLLATINGEEVDHLPLYSWVFGFTAPKHLRWMKNGKEVKHWYTMRMEHIHTLPEHWDIEDDFKRVKAWLSLGCDDVLDVSLLWSIHPKVRIVNVIYDFDLIRTMIMIDTIIYGHVTQLVSLSGRLNFRAGRSATVFIRDEFPLRTISGDGCLRRLVLV